MFFIFVWFFLVLSLIFLLGKSSRLIFFLFGLEVLMLSLLVYFLFLFYFFSFFFIGVFGVISSVGCLVLFLKVVVLVGKDQVFY